MALWALRCCSIAKYLQLRRYCMTKTNNLEIRCNCDPDQPEMVVHLVNGIIPIIIIKCEKCEAFYTVMPNSVQDA